MKCKEALLLYWRFYRTRNNRKIIKEQLDTLDVDTHASIVAAMKDVEKRGIVAASRPVRGPIREIDAHGPDETTYRLLFAKDGRVGQILVGLVFFEKRTRKTPPREIEIAEARLRDWKSAREEAEREAAKRERDARSRGDIARKLRS